MKAYGERRQSSNHFEPKHYVEISDQLRVPVIFLPMQPSTAWWLRSERSREEYSFVSAGY